MGGRRWAAELCPGIIFPTPYPQGYGDTPPLPRARSPTHGVPGSMHEHAPYGNGACTVQASARTPGSLPRRPTLLPPSHLAGAQAAKGTTGRPCSYPATTPRSTDGTPAAPASSVQGSTIAAGSTSPPRPPSRRAAATAVNDRAPSARTLRHRGRTTRPDSAPGPPPDPATVWRTAHLQPGAHGIARGAHEMRRADDGWAYAQPNVSSQLRTHSRSLAKRPANPLATWEERTACAPHTLRGRAMRAMPTSHRGLQVERFVIECFAPSCLVDNVPDRELVTPAPRDAVDSIMSIEVWGLVQNRGETCRSDRPDKNGETRTPRGA